MHTNQVTRGSQQSDSVFPPRPFGRKSSEIGREKTRRGLKGFGGCGKERKLRKKRARPAEKAWRGVGKKGNCRPEEEKIVGRVCAGRRESAEKSAERVFRLVRFPEKGPRSTSKVSLRSLRS